MRNSVAAAFVAACLFAGTAAAETYICKTKPQGRNSWDEGVLALNYNRETGEILVSSAIILASAGKPVQAKLTHENDKRFTVTWELRLVKQGKSISLPRLLYRLTLYKRTKKVIMAGFAAGYDGRFGATGKCRVRK